MSETLAGWLGHVDLLLAAAREGSATKAARSLGLSTATAIRHLEAMEERLGVRFFDRTPAGLLPTAALSVALPWAEQIEAAGHGLVRELSGLETEPAGPVRISLLETTSSWIVAPRLPALLERYPDLEISLVPEARVVDLVRREADIVVRTSRPTAGDFVTRQLMTCNLAVAASPRLLARIKPQSLSDLPWIDWDATAARTPDVVWLEQNVPNAQVVLRTTSVTTMLHAARAGLGAVVIAAPLAAAIGGLVPVKLDMPSLPELSMHLVTHRALRPIPRVAVVWDYLVEIFDTVMAQIAADVW